MSHIKKYEFYFKINNIEIIVCHKLHEQVHFIVKNMTCITVRI